MIRLLAGSLLVIALTACTTINVSLDGDGDISIDAHKEIASDGKVGL